MSGTAAQLVKWVQPPQYLPAAHPLSSHFSHFFLFFLSTDSGTDCNCNCTINHFHSRYKLHRVLLATCCQMLEISLSVFPNKNSDPDPATRSAVQRPQRAALSLPRHVPLASQFLDLWLSFEYNYVVSKIFESARKLRPCIFETSNSFEHV